MTLNTPEVIKEINETVVSFLNEDSFLTSVVDGRVYDNDLQVLTIDQFPAITVQIRKITPSSQTSGFRFDKVRFMIRGYSEVLARSETAINEEQMDLGGGLIDVFTTNYTLGGLCTLADVVDLDFQFYQDRESLQITRQCVEITLGCSNFLRRV